MDIEQHLDQLLSNPNYVGELLAKGYDEIGKSNDPNPIAAINKMNLAIINLFRQGYKAGYHHAQSDNIVNQINDNDDTNKG